MKLDLPDEHVNELQRRSIIKLVDRLKHAKMIDVVIQCRINGEDKVIEADWLKHLTFSDTWVLAEIGQSPGRSRESAR